MEISRDQIEKLKKEALNVLLKNRREKDGHQYTVPSPESYPYQWFWDSCFHAIILSHFSVDDAKKEINSLLSQQFENGLIPHIIYWEKSPFPVSADIEWGRGDTSSITQPPLIAEAIWHIYERDHDKKFLEETYSNLYHFYNYILNERDPRRYHLAGIINPDESGEDNSPRFDKLLNLPPHHDRKTNQEHRNELVEKLKSCNFDAPFCMKNFFWVKDVPFNSILVKNLSILSKISEVTGYKEDALHFEEQSLRISRAMRDRMMEGDFFWSTYGENYEKIKIKTWAIFAPLYGNILSKEEAERLVREHLFNETEFEALFAVPTVSKDEESYDPEGFWRGPVWMASNWFIYKGLLNYDMKEEASRILESSLKLLEKSGFREYFNPDNGEGLGAEDFTWGALIIDMIEDNK